jgi:hypothetical protein
MKKFLTFLNEPSGKVSFMRLTGFLLVFVYIIMFIYIGITDKKISDIPTNLMVLILALYGINKIERIFNGRKNESSYKAE